MPSARKTVVGITSKNMKLLYNRFMIFGELTEKEWRELDFKCRSFLQSDAIFGRVLGWGGVPRVGGGGRRGGGGGTGGRCWGRGW